MIVQLIKKEILMYWRRPRELVILLLMPFVLITILGTALESINGKETPNLSMKLAFIQKNDVEAEEQKLMDRLEGLPISEAEKKAAIEGIKSANPIRILQEDVLESKELKDLLKVEYVSSLSEDEAEKYSAIVEIPEHFTEQYFAHVFFEGKEIPEMKLKINESSSLEGSIIKDIFTSFQEEMTFWTTTQSLGINPVDLREKMASKVGTTKPVSEKRTISSVAYYAIGMSVMFMFYVAGNAATLAFEEKENQIFGRILLANMPVPIFFSGIFVSTFLVTLSQINILYGLSALIHKVTWPSILDYLVVTVLLSLMVGAFATLISSISYRINSGGAVQVFSNALIPILAFIGGSFVPVAQLGSIFENISKFSPGGAGISAYYKIMQGYSLGDVSTQLIVILITTLILMAVTLLIQPKRGEFI